MRLLWLAEDCRAAGLIVKELGGWQGRGAEFIARPNTVIAHHTGTPKAARGDLPTQRILIEGRADLPGPLCQVGLGRNGTVYIVASGKANHAGKGTWRGTTASAYTVGIEAENPGDGKPWPDKQYDAYVRLCAVLLRGLGQGAERLAAHREWALPLGRKVDPAGIDMDRMRLDVARKLSNFQHPKPPPTSEVDVTDDEIEKVAERVFDKLKGYVATHQDMVVLLRGTADGKHAANLTNIARAVGVKDA